MSKMHLMTPTEAAEYMHNAYTVKTLLQRASLRRVPSVKLGGKRLFIPSELDLWRDAGATPEVAREINNAREIKAKKAIKQL